MPPIRKGDGTPVAPKGISQVRTGDGRIFFDGPAIPDEKVYDSPGIYHEDVAFVDGTFVFELGGSPGSTGGISSAFNTDSKPGGGGGGSSAILLDGDLVAESGGGGGGGGGPDNSFDTRRGSGGDGAFAEFELDLTNVDQIEIYVGEEPPNPANNDNQSVGGEGYTDGQAGDGPSGDFGGDGGRGGGVSNAIGGDGATDVDDGGDGGPGEININSPANLINSQTGGSSQGFARLFIDNN